MNNEEIKNKIAELEKSDDIRDLFLAMKLVSHTFDEDLLSDFIKKYKDKIYKKDPILFIGYHVNFYVLQEKYIEALQVLKCYQNEPFINLTTDDFMNDLEKEIKKLMTPTKQHKYSLLDAEQDIYSQNEDKLSKAISFLSQYNVRNCLPFFKDALISSILGDFGKSIQKNVFKFIKADLVDFMASDCHSLGVRKPNLKEALEFVKKKFNKEIENKINL